MRSFFAKCTAVGIVAGGFALTGDLGRLADRGRRLLEASTVPSETPAVPADAVEAGPAPSAGTASAGDVASPAAAAAPAPQPAAAAPATATKADPANTVIRLAEAAADAPVGRAVTVPAPPAAGPESLELSRLSAGRRVIVWVRRRDASGRPRATDLVAFDVIDAASGEALEHRHAALSHGGGHVVQTAPRRVLVGRESAGRIAKGMPLRVVPLHGVNGPGPAEDLGTVVAVDLAGR